MAYRLALPPQLHRVHDVFHISQLRRYVHDPTHIIDHGELDVDDGETFVEVPVEIEDQ